uniref:PDZ domain-containing protein n=1 Tax=Eutreptiella gymnastica TaxID=73025 RepID=A0A7S1ISZ3_9EUGL|mmetsp:Transcript_40780/g.73003  ORF Transcript_40780/g.73003 Transcript_40780/m.73003 type:complete len:291 (+) Transcript_40780:30-902(+)
MQGVDFQSVDSEPWCVSARQIAAMVATTSLIASIAAGIVVFSTPHQLYVPITSQSMGRALDTTVPFVRAPSTKIWHNAHAFAPTTIRKHLDSKVIGHPRMDVNQPIAQGTKYFHGLWGLTTIAIAFSTMFYVVLSQIMNPRKYVAVFATSGETSAIGTDENGDEGWSTYDVTVRKPLGITLEDNIKSPKIGSVYVFETIQGGNAEKAGVRAGDVLQKCSAVKLKDGTEGQFQQQGHGATPYRNFESFAFDTRGETFDTVMAAIASNNERWGYFDVSLRFARPVTPEADSD